MNVSGSISGAYLKDRNPPPTTTCPSSCTNALRSINSVNFQTGEKAMVRLHTYRVCDGMFTDLKIECANIVPSPV